VKKPKGVHNGEQCEQRKKNYSTWIVFCIWKPVAYIWKTFNIAFKKVELIWNNELKISV